MPGKELAFLFPQSRVITPTYDQRQILDYPRTSESNGVEPFVSNEFGDRFLYSVNRHCFDGVGSDAVYRSRWGESLFKENTLYIIAGSDSGVLISYIDKRGVPKGSRYLFVELDELAEHIQPRLQESAASQNMHMCNIANWLEVARQHNFAAYAYLDSVQVLRSLAVDDANLPAYRTLWRELEQNTQQVLWTFRVELGNSTFFTRQMENVCENRHSAYCLKDLFKDKTAVLLAGGPSLDDILPWVMEHRENLVVVAVSRISRRLQQLNFQPDIIVTVDPHACSFDVSKHMLRLHEQAILVNAYHATPLLLGQWAGPSLYLDHRYPWKKDPHNHIINGAGPTVSNSAINLIIAMGCKQIVLAGLDLCFSAQGFSHAQGSDERNAGAFLAYADQTVVTNSGAIAETDNPFFTAIKSIETQAKHAREQGCKLLNPSANAARIHNVDFVALSDIEFSPLEQPAIDTIRQALPKDDSATRLACYQQAAKEFDQAQYTFEKIKQLAKQALEHNDGLFGRNGKKADFKHKLQMDKIEKQLNKNHKEHASLCKLFGMKEFIKTFSTTEAEDWSDEEIETKGRVYYQAYISGADDILQLIRAGKTRIESRIAEEKDSPDFSTLFLQWQKDRQPGRAFIWQNRHEQLVQELDQEVVSQLQQMASDLNKEIDNNEHAHIKKIKQYASLHGVTGKALEFFKNRDSDGLQRLLNGLATRGEVEADILHNLVSGYDAELNGQNDIAIEHYQHVVIHETNTANPALENALSRLAYLALEHHELTVAGSFLEALCGLSPAYMPQYADILRMTNQLQRAVDVYTEYLSVAPDDLSTMMKLALLYKRIGAKESAQWLFEHILQKDPGNEAAQDLLQQVKLSA